LQAWRDCPSHLGTETPFDATVASVLGAGGAALTSLSEATRCRLVATAIVCYLLTAIAVLGFDLVTRS